MTVLFDHILQTKEPLETWKTNRVDSGLLEGAPWRTQILKLLPKQASELPWGNCILKSYVKH